MIKYVKIINENGLCEVGLGTNIEFYKSIGMTEKDVKQSDVDGNWYLTGLCPMKTDEQKEEERKAEISQLKLTRGDVFRGLLLARGITRTMLRSTIESLSEETAEAALIKEMALIDFDEALDFYRGNSLIDTVGLTLGITTEQLDNFFVKGNSTDKEVKENAWKELLPVEEPEVEEPENPTETIENPEEEEINVNS